jgi:dTDP-4-dehydrorhamnose 3,5-epimerase
MSLTVELLSISGVIMLTPERFPDSRGFFSETYNAERFRAFGVRAEFIQDNHSYSAQIGTVRGLHFQSPPFAQSKLVRVLRGAIVDVVVDARKGSRTFGRWVKAELSADNGRQLYVPCGFLHGFVTLQTDTEVHYKVDAPYSKEHDVVVRWDDPDLAIDWGIDSGSVILSEKDAAAPFFRDLVSPF